MPMPNNNAKPVSRRSFIRTAAASTASMAAGAGARGATPDRIRVGLVGCGGRGTGAVHTCVNAAPNVELYALADLFADRLDEAADTLQGNGRRNKDIGAKFNVSRDRRFTGWNACAALLDSGVDLVILATPPHFRPEQFRAAVMARKHCFVEKPAGVDPAGLRSVMESVELARKRDLSVMAGTQRRHAPGYVEIMKRVHDGAIGDLVSGQCYWNTGGLWVKDRRPEWSDMEYQVRNWLYHTWLSGDHIVEQHIHNVDVMNWAFGGVPLRASGVGGRQSRTGARYGDVFDHFAVEFEYSNGARVMSMCRQAEGAARANGERIVGTKGVADPKAGSIQGERPYLYEGPARNGQAESYAKLIASIRDAAPVNEGAALAGSTLAVVAGRMSAYTGRVVHLDWAAQRSKLDLRPGEYSFGSLPEPEVPVPGKTPLV